MDNLVAQHPGLVSKVNIGYSFENRPMDVLKVHRRAAAFPAGASRPRPRPPAGRRSGLCRPAVPARLLPAVQPVPAGLRHPLPTPPPTPQPVRSPCAS